MNTKNIKSTFIPVCIFVSLSGFTDFFFKDDVFQETENSINQIKLAMMPRAEIAGLETKELTPYVPYRMTATNIDPFIVKSFVSEVGQGQEAEDGICDEGCGDGPPLPHTPFILENYSLDQLSMRGTLADPSRGKIALIQTPDSGIVNAAIGEYLGRNNGLIIGIDRDRIIIQEKYRTPQGWQNRNAILPLTRN